MQERSMGLKGVLGVEDGGKRFDVHLDEVNGSLHGGTVFRNDQGYRFPTVSDPAVGQNGLILVYDPLTIGPRNVRRGQNGKDPLEGSRFRDVNAADHPMGDPRAFDTRPEQVLGIMIGGVLFFSGDFCPGVKPRDGMPDAQYVCFQGALSLKFHGF